MEIPEIVKTLIRQAAPTLAMALPLPPPFSLVAAAAVTAALKKWMPAGMTPTVPQGDGTYSLSPEQVVAITAQNAANPQFNTDLQRAELDLKAREMELPYRFAALSLEFAKLENEDRADARKSSVSTVEQSDRVYRLGLSTIANDKWFSYIIVGGGFSLLATTAFTRVTIDPTFSNVVFSLLGILYGKHSSRADQVVNFFFGTSQGSKEKDSTISEVFNKMGTAIGRNQPQSQRPPQVTEETITVPAAPVVAGGSVTVSGTTPEDNTSTGPVAWPGGGRQPNTSVGTLRAIMEPLRTPHSRFPGGAVWHLEDDGIHVNESLEPLRTPGQPVTVRRIWSDYQGLIKEKAATYGVPIELIVATIAAESGGNPKAFRQEPKDASAGLMQTLTGTAGDMLKRKVAVAELYDPAVSLEAGTAYIAYQKNKTELDPILVAAAYNSGGLRPASNRWALYCWTPTGGEHIENFAKFFGDAMVVSSEDSWGADGTISFASAFKAQ